MSDYNSDTCKMAAMPLYSVYKKYWHEYCKQTTFLHLNLIKTSNNPSKHL